jgi:hypothetical protein
MCTAGDYCLTSGGAATGLCNPGCLNEANCAVGQTCDLSAATTTPTGQTVGVCRAPTAAETFTCMPTSPPPNPPPHGPCDDVHGAYNVTYKSASSDPACGSSDASWVCTVAQSACALRFTCDRSAHFLFADTAIDSSDKGQSTLAGPMGMTLACSFAFDASAHAFAWECTPAYMGRSIDCKGTATLRQ